MKTLQDMKDAGYVRVCVSSSNVTLWTSDDNTWTIKLTNGVNGFGVQANKIEVILVYKRPENKTFARIQIKKIEENVEGVRSRSGNSWAIADFALKSDIDAARDQLIAMVNSSVISK